MGNPTDNEDEEPLQAILLADSFTSTFHPITLPLNSHTPTSTPRVLLPLNNVTLLDYSLEFLSVAGVRELFVFCVSGGDAIRHHLDKRKDCIYGSGAASSSSAKQQETTTTPSSAMTIHCIIDKNCRNAGDALREIDRRGLIRSNNRGVVLMHGDVISNIDVSGVIKRHETRKKKDGSAIMTVLLKERVPSTSALRTVAEDLVVGLDAERRILLWSDDKGREGVSLPCGFFETAAVGGRVEVRRDLLDVGIDIVSPEVLARFSDEFDYSEIRRHFLANSVAEEEEGLQNKIYAHVLSPQSGEYAARVRDLRSYHQISRDLLRRYCYPVVPENLPSGYERSFRYQLQRHFVYREVKQKKARTRIARSADVGRESMVGSGCRIGENCRVKGTVMGHNVTIHSSTTVLNSHLWSNVQIYQNVSITDSILCQNAIIRAGAVIPRGCVIGQGCIIGEGVALKEFTRVTMCVEDDEGDDGSWGDDDLSSEEESGSSEEDDDGFSSSDASEEEDDDGPAQAAAATKTATTTSTTTASTNNNNMLISDVHIVGPDGLGRLWTPPLKTDDDSSDDDDSTTSSNDDDEDEDARQRQRSLDKMKSQSMGFDASEILRQRQLRQAKQAQKIEDEVDDFFTDEDTDDDDEKGGSKPQGGDDDEDEFGFTNLSLSSPPTTTDDMILSDTADDAAFIIGRQRGVDVIADIKTICLEHNAQSSIENLMIEVNSYKFSQNATFSDVVTGAMHAILERLCRRGQFAENNDEQQKEEMTIVEETREMMPVAFATAFKGEMERCAWGDLLRKMCHSMEEEKTVLYALETVALMGQTTTTTDDDGVVVDNNDDDDDDGEDPNNSTLSHALSTVLRRAPAFRLVLQMLHDDEVVNEDAIMMWAEERRGEGEETERGRLFMQKETQDFLEWLEDDDDEESGSGSGSEEESGSDEE